MQPFTDLLSEYNADANADPITTIRRLHPRRLFTDRHINAADADLRGFTCELETLNDTARYETTTRADAPPSPNAVLDAIADTEGLSEVYRDEMHNGENPRNTAFGEHSPERPETRASITFRAERADDITTLVVFPLVRDDRVVGYEVWAASGIGAPDKQMILRPDA